MVLAPAIGALSTPRSTVWSEKCKGRLRLSRKDWGTPPIHTPNLNSPGGRPREGLNLFFTPPANGPVKERIVIRKPDGTARRNYLQVGDKRAVFLKQGVTTMRRERKSRCACQRLQ